MQNAFIEGAPAAELAYAQTVSSPRPFTQLTLETLVPELARRFSSMTLDEVLTILPCLDKVQAGQRDTASPDDVARSVLALPGRSKLQEAERAVIAHALATSNGNVSAAARLIGMDRKAMERKIRRHGLGGKRK